MLMAQPSTYDKFESCHMFHSCVRAEHHEHLTPSCCDLARTTSMGKLKVYLWELSFDKDDQFQCGILGPPIISNLIIYIISIIIKVDMIVSDIWKGNLSVFYKSSLHDIHHPAILDH